MHLVYKEVPRRKPEVKYKRIVKMMRSSFFKEDVTLLLKDITGMIEPLSTNEREKLIQSGVHYCEMMPLEYKPSEKYLAIYDRALQLYSKKTADAIMTVSEKIMAKKGKNVVLISLARAGIPIGILMKRYLDKKYGIHIPHYSISIIRGRGIDKNAVNYILKRHRQQDIMFVDGWIGKGAIFGELKKELESFKELQPEIAVVSDPANLTEMCGTHEDILIASSCLNSTVSGLISRTFLRDDIIGKEDFHGAAYYGDLKNEDRTYEFIEKIEELFVFEENRKNSIDREKRTDDEKHMDKRNMYNTNMYNTRNSVLYNGIEEVERICETYNIDNINFVKPGIGETTRVLLRRVPWKILISEKYRDSDELCHIYQLAEEKGVNVEYTELMNYKCCGLIKKVADA